MNNSHFEKYKEVTYKAFFILMIIFDYYFMYLDFGWYPPRNYLSAFLMIFVSFDLRNGLKHFLITYKLSLIILLINLYSPIVGYFHTGEFSGLKNILKFTTLAFSMQFLLQRVELKFVFKTVLYVVGLSFSVAFLQLFFPELGWPIREFIDPVTYHELARPALRPAGLAYYTLTLSEQLLLAFPCLILLMSERFTGVVRSEKFKFLASLAFLLLTGLIGNRGLTFGVILGMIFYFRGNFKKLNKQFFVAIGLIGLLLVGLHFTSNIFRFVSRGDGLRVDVLRISLMIIKDNFWFGIGSQVHDLKSIIIEYGQTIRDTLLVPNELGLVGPHNYFINMQLKFGVVGTVANLFLIYKARFIFWGLVGIYFNSLFHNGGLLNSSTIMISYFILSKVAFSQKNDINHKI